MRLNLDADELDDEPEELTALADMVNVACGAHAGDEPIAHRALRRAKASGVAVGAWDDAAWPSSCVCEWAR